MIADRLIMILPDALGRAWPLVRDRIAAIAARDGEPWIAEDVFFDIRRGSAYLWATEDFGGFVVLTIQEAPYARDLHIWIGCEDTEANVADYWPQLLEIAAENRCKRIFFESQRRWDRALPGLTARRIYSCPVE